MRWTWTEYSRMKKGRVERLEGEDKREAAPLVLADGEKGDQRGDADQNEERERAQKDAGSSSVFLTFTGVVPKRRAEREDENEG